MNRIFIILPILFSLAACQPQNKTEEQTKAPTEETIMTPQERVAAVVDSMGGRKKWQQLEDMTYTYSYINRERGTRDVSTERYVFGGEKSWGQYDEHTQSVFPNQPGRVIQVFDGKNSWVTLNGRHVTEIKQLARANFSRKTNYYWMNMFFKLQDPGLVYEDRGQRDRYGITYDLVSVGFEDGVGDAQDTYLLYINPETNLVDCFLFTVMEFGRAEPLMMEVKYEEVDGLLWPTYRRYRPATWEGEEDASRDWVEEISEDLALNTGFDRGIFEY